MSLITILQQIEANRSNAEMSLEMVSPSTYGSRVGIKRAAQEAIKRLEEQYHDELLKTTAYIVVTGSQRDSFTELATAPAFGCFSQDPEGLFKDIAAKMNPALFGHEGVKYLFNTASNILEDRAMELDIKSYNMLQFNDKYNSAVTKAEDFVPLIRNAIVDQVGSEIIGLNAVKAIVGQAIKNGHSAPVTPVIFSTSDERFALELRKNLKSHSDKNGELRGLTSKVFLVVAGKSSVAAESDTVFVKKVNEESVGDALAAIRAKVL